MKRTSLALLLLFITLAGAFAQESTYKIFERKRGSAYRPTLAGADEKYIYVFTPGISAASKNRNTDAVLNTYRVGDFEPVKSKETDFTYKGKELKQASVYVFGKYVLLTYHNYDRKADIVSLIWVALDRETLEPVKDGVLGEKKLNTLDDVAVNVSPDGQTMVVLYGNPEKELVACFDKDLSVIWESDLSIAGDRAINGRQIDNNQNVYILTNLSNGGTPQIMTLKNKGTSKGTQDVAIGGDKNFLSGALAVSGDGNEFVGGIYSNGEDSPDGVFTMKIAPDGTKVSDTREIPYLNKKSIKWHSGAGATDRGEFYFYSANTSKLDINSYTSSGAPAGGVSFYLLDGYAAVYVNASGKIDHAMNWNHFPIPVPEAPVSLAPMIENGKPFLFTDYSKQQLDKWGKTDYSKEVPSVKERIKSPTRQICAVTNFDQPSATMPTPLFTMGGNGYFGCSEAKYVPSLHTMVFFGCVTEGKYGQGYTNFCLGKAILK